MQLWAISNLGIWHFSSSITNSTKLHYIIVVVLLLKANSTSVTMKFKTLLSDGLLLLVSLLSILQNPSQIVLLSWPNTIKGFDPFWKSSWKTAIKPYKIKISRMCSSIGKLETVGIVFSFLLIHTKLRIIWLFLSFLNWMWERSIHDEILYYIGNHL